MPSWRPGSTRPGSTKNGMPTSWNSPFEKRGPPWQTLQLPAPTKIARPRCAAHRIARCGGAVAARERVAKIVERRAAGHERLLVRGERLGHVDGDRFRRRPAARARTRHDSARAGRRRRGSRRPHARSRCPFRARRAIGRRLCAHRLSCGAVPAVPALAADVDKARRVAVDARDAARARQAIGERARGLMAGRARDGARARERRIVRNRRVAEGDGRGVAGDAVGRIDRARRRPRSEREDARALARR